ncbi:hypothetical protein AB0J82_23210 [Asanoa sp. NPDC049518]|uniref:hypothetical protein n=1 Tax=unclassified Asanoa TaxID=2685164 RepID=UPI0034202372
MATDTDFQQLSEEVDGPVLRPTDPGGIYPVHAATAVIGVDLAGATSRPCPDSPRARHECLPQPGDAVLLWSTNVETLLVLRHPDCLFINSRGSVLTRDEYLDT